MKLWKRFGVAFVFFLLLLLYQGVVTIPEKLTMFAGEEHTIHTVSAVSLSTDQDSVKVEKKRAWNGEVFSVWPEKEGSFDCTVSVLGIPCRTIEVNVAENRTVMASGNAVGVKIHASGLMTVGFSDIGTRCPALESGMAIGDVILEADGEKIENTAHFSRLVEKSKGEPMVLRLRRENREMDITLTPAKDGDGNFRIGAWVRDSIAGVGTLTFYDKESGWFTSLGHSISDYDTGEVMEVKEGSIVATSIEAIEKGEPGKAGELRGRFVGEEDLGAIEENESYGVCGTLYDTEALDGMEVPIGLKTQLHVGDVTILTTIEGTEPKEYQARIDKILSLRGNKNMIIRITDKELLKKTGGIVQGMSGSPILQDGKLIGAITHVFVDDPTRGYAISVENMMGE